MFIRRPYLLPILLGGILGGTIGPLFAGWVPKPKQFPDLNSPFFLAEIEDHVGRMSPSSNGWDLVMFIDYSCGPCRSSDFMVRGLTRRKSYGLLYVPYPLPGRADSLQAAINVAMTTDDNARKALILETLQADSLDPESRLALLNSVGVPAKLVSNQEAREQVIEDLQSFQKRVKLPGTPTFAVRKPNGEMREMASLQAAMIFLDSK